VPTKRVKYRGYEFEVYSPISGGDRWHVVMWPPNNSPPITTPTVASGVEAIAEARATVDHILDRRPAP
jgi:hypothetical protein